MVKVKVKCTKRWSLKFSVDGLTDERKIIIAQELIDDYKKFCPITYVGVDGLHEWFSRKRLTDWRFASILTR